VESGEQCDDGNAVGGDGCSSTCQKETTSPPSPIPASRSLILQKNEYYDLASGIALTGSLSDKWKTTDLNYINHDNQDWFTSPYADFATQTDKQSSAAMIYMGQGELDSFTCPVFKQELPYGNFNYFPNRGYPYVDDKALQVGGAYCLVNHDNSKYFKFKVLGKTNDTATINYIDIGPTGVKTYGCVDGYCNNKAQVYCIGCTSQDIPSIQKTFQLQQEAKACLDSYLGIDLPALRMTAYASDLYPCQSSQGLQCKVFGNAGPAVKSWGFVGLRDSGETKTRLENIRLELHENMHHANLLVGLSTPSWFDEGMAVQTATRINCGPNTMFDQWRVDDSTYTDLRDGRTTLSALGFSAQSNPQAMGSLFMRALELDYACGQDCVAKIWSKLVTDYAYNNTYVTNQRIKQAVDAITGKDTTALFVLLGLN
jgi:cysteine-rich repeat protein